MFKQSRSRYTQQFRHFPCIFYNFYNFSIQYGRKYSWNMQLHEKKIKENLNIY